MKYFLASIILAVLLALILLRCNNAKSVGVSEIVLENNDQAIVAQVPCAFYHFKGTVLDSLNRPAFVLIEALGDSGFVAGTITTYLEGYYELRLDQKKAESITTFRVRQEGYDTLVKKFSILDADTCLVLNDFVVDLIPENTEYMIIITNRSHGLMPVSIDTIWYDKSKK